MNQPFGNKIGKWMENVVTLDFTVVSHSFLSNVLYMC